MATSSWKTLKTIENLAGKPDLTMRSCLILANSFFPGVIKFGRILKNLQKNIPLLTVWGAILHQFAKRLTGTNPPKELQKPYC
jgi:hypothetical protein